MGRGSSLRDSGDPLRKRERILEQEPWASMRVTGLLKPSESNQWLIKRFVVPEEDRTQRLEMLHMGRYVPPGIVFTGLLQKSTTDQHAPLTLVMSDTPDELTDHGPIIARAASATGSIRVLVNGLGLGCVVKGLLAIEQVAHVDVVEVDADLARLVGPYYVGRRISRLAVRKSVSSMDGRVTIHLADAFTKEWPQDIRWDLVWHDVWDSMDPANLSDEARAVPGTYDALLARYADRCGWQGAWGEQVLRRDSTPET